MKHFSLISLNVATSKLSMVVMICVWLIGIGGGGGFSLLFSANSIQRGINFADESNKSDRCLLIVGYGRVGQECAKWAKGRFNNIHGTVRSKAKPGNRQLGNTSNEEDMVETIDFGVDNLRSYFQQHEPTHVLITLQPLRDSSQSTHPRGQLQVDRSELDTSMSSSFQEQQNVFDLLREMIPHHAWIGLLSTTGVYGNHDGAWVTEDSSLLCSDGSNAALYRDYEYDWKQWIERATATTTTTASSNEISLISNATSSTYPLQRQLCIFRCSGIYDSSRSALHTVYKNGLSLERMPDSCNETGSSHKSRDITNRIHATDIALAVVSSMLQHENRPAYWKESYLYRIYNLADDLPESRKVVLAYAATLLKSIGIPVATKIADIGSKSRRKCKKQEPRSGTASYPASPGRRDRRRLEERKLISNQRMKQELSLDPSRKQEQGKSGRDARCLLYPTYREGLAAILLDPSTPWHQDLLNTKE